MINLIKKSNLTKKLSNGKFNLYTISIQYHDFIFNRNCEEIVINTSEKSSKKELLSYKVYKYLKNEIIKSLSNNSNLNLSENYLSQKLNVSRTPVREAISRLTAEGFLTNYSNYGVTVNKVSIEDLKELVQIRMAIEGLAVQLACNRIDKEKIRELKRLVRLLKKSINRKDVMSFYKIDVEFHDRIIDYSGNKKLKNIYETLKSQSLPFRIKSFSRISRLEESCLEIEKIVEALESHNYSKALSLFQEHIGNGYKNMLLIEKLN